MNDLAIEIKEAVDCFKRKQAEVDEFLKSEAAWKTQTASEVKEAVSKVNDLVTKCTDQAARLHDIEQRMTENVIKGKECHKTVGAMFVESESYKQYAAGSTTKARVETKNTIIGQTGAGLSDSTLVAPDRLGWIVSGAYRLPKIRDAIPAGVTNSNAVEYTRELAYANNAAETAEGAAKPESSLTFELVSTPVRTVAHWIKASRQVLDDSPALQSYIDTRLRYGVDHRIDDQLLNGNGTGQNLSGMMAAGNHTAYTPTAGDTPLDSINKAIYQVWQADYAPTGIIMSPADWGAIERLKSDGTYVISNPIDGAIRHNLWGFPVIVTNAMQAGKFLVGAFDIAYQAWYRNGTVIEMSESDDDNFQKNLVTIRAESRLALAVYRPAAAVGGNLTA